MRPSRDEYFMSIARLVSSRSTCLRRKVGALIEKKSHILSTGYNGAPKGLPHCEEVGCLREAQRIPPGQRHELCRGVHAEQNAIVQAAVFGVSISGATLYTTHKPCVLCAKMLINAEIEEIVYQDDYLDPLAKELLDQSRIELRHYRSKSLVDQPPPP